jgi:hypothetical protein
MKEEAIKLANPPTLSFECEACGEFFESWDRLRQHQVDCEPDEFDSSI